MPKRPLVEAALRKPLEERKSLLESNLDKVFIAYIKRRDKYECVMGGEQRGLHIGYIFNPKDYPNVRWDPMNAHLLSNVQYTHYHESNPFIYLDWFIDHYSSLDLTSLRARAESRTRQWPIQTMIDMTNDFVKKTRAIPKEKRKNEE